MAGYGAAALEMVNSHVIVVPHVGRDNRGLVLRDGDRGRPCESMILCGGATGGVSGKGRRWNLPRRAVLRREGQTGRGGNNSFKTISKRA